MAAPQPIGIQEEPQQLDGYRPTTSGMTGQTATFAATVQTAATGGSLEDLMKLRSVYERNGKDKEFDVTVEMWKANKKADAKQAIYDRLAKRAERLPNQPPVDLNDPDQAAIANDIVSAYAATDGGAEALDLAVRNSLAMARNRQTANPHEAALAERKLMEAQQVSRDFFHGRANLEGEIGAIYNMINIPRDSIPKGLAKVAGEAWKFLVPLRDELVAQDVMDALGVPEERRTWKTWFAGEAYQVTREWLAELSPNEQAQALIYLRQHMEANPDRYGDVTIWDTMSSVMPDTLAKQGTPTSTLDRIFRNLGTIGNVWAAADAIKSTLNVGRKVMLNGSIALINATNPKAAQRTLADLYLAVDSSKTLSAWGTKTSEVALTQLPKPSVGSAVNLPDGVPKAAQHIENVRNDLEEVLKNARQDLFSNEEIVGAVEREAERIATAQGGKLRLGRSDLSLFDDRSGVRFGSVIGSSDTHGFSDLESALKFGAQLDESGKRLKILEVMPDGTLKPIASGDAAKPGALPNRPGEFYVRHEEDYFFRPEDKLLFGDDPVVSPSWLGRAALWVLTPSAVINKSVYNKGVRAFLTEQSIASDMNRLIAPFFKELDWKQQQTASKMWEWTSDFGKREGRYPKWAELNEAFPDAGQKEMLGWYYMKNFFDTAYHVENQALYREFASSGYRTIRAGGTTFHGKPITLDTVYQFRDPDTKNFTFWNPVTGAEENLTKAQMKKFFEDGGQLVHLPIPVSAGPGGRLTTLVMHRPGSGSTFEALSKFPLKHEIGYTPRLYLDNIFIKKTSEGVSINGRTTSHTTTVATAPDRRSANDLVERLNASRGDDSVSYHIDEDDPRLSDRDRTARDLQHMQIEGRIFFDARNADPLASATGGRAEIVDPVNAMLRTGRMLSRQVATEDLVRTMKSSFAEQWGHLIPGGIANKTSSEVGTLLTGLVKNSNGPQAKVAGQALQLWDYIRVMEGSLYGGGTEFRRLAVRAAEFVQNNILPKGSRVGTLLARNAEKFAPVEWMKSLAFFDFMTTRPLRQLVLQGSQHMFLQGLDPTYAGKWQMDTFLLLSGARARNFLLAGMGEQAKFLRTRNAKLMGVSLDEYDTLVAKFNQSGLAQTVNLHTFASDVMPEASQVPTSALGKGADMAVGAATARPIRKLANKWGFQAGEGYNVAASYMMAVRRIRKEKGYKKLTQMTDEDWTEATSRGSNYALAMHRANASRYQYGLLSLPMQFLSFTHKVFLTFLQALPDKMGGKLGNKAFTKAEARKILVGQYLMFGAAGFGLKPEAEQFLTSIGMEKYADGKVVELLAGGFLDMMLDYALQKAIDDPEIDLPFDEFLAPGANVVNTIRSFWEAGFENSVAETLVGPSGQTVGRLYEAAQIASDMAKVDYPEWTPEQELGIVLESTLAGFASGYNDYLKARLAWRTGELLSQAGVPHKYHASREEAIAKGMFGVTSTGQKELWALTMDVKNRTMELDGIAKEYHDRMLKVTQIYANQDQWSYEYYRNRIAMERAVLAALPEEERRYVLQKFDALEAGRKLENAGIVDTLIGAIGKGGAMPADWLIYRLKQSNAVEPKDLPILIEEIKKHDKALKDAGPLWDQKLERSDEVIQELEALDIAGRRQPQPSGPPRSLVKPTPDTPKAFQPSGTLSEEQKTALLLRAKATQNLDEKADIARQLGASEEDIQKILAKAPRRKS